MREKSRHDDEALGSGFAFLFPRHVSPNKVHASPINLSKNSKYPLVLPPIPKGVMVQGDMMVQFPRLLNTNHDFSKYMEFKTKSYM